QLLSDGRFSGPHYACSHRSCGCGSGRPEAHRAESPLERVSNLAATGRQVGLAATLRGDLTGWIRGVRADFGVAGDLRGDLVLGTAQNAGDRNSDGTRRIGAGLAIAHR